LSRDDDEVPPSQPSREAKSSIVADDRGFFQIAAVPPADYQVVVEEQGWTRDVRKIRVLPALEATLREPLVIGPPQDVTFLFSPPLDPWSKPWRISVLRGGGRHLTRLAGPAEASKDGKWLTKLGPGTYKIQVSRSGGSGWNSQDIEVFPTGAVQEIPIEVPAIEVHGWIRYGKDPIVARITFGGRSGSSRVSLASNDAGYFEGYLPSTNGVTQFPLYVEADQPFIRRTTKPLDVRPGEAVEINLPKTELNGTIVDDSGNPIATGAIVSIAPPEDPFVQTIVGPESRGVFKLSAFAPGTYHVFAEAKGLRSDDMQVEVKEDRTEKVQLVVHAQRTLKMVVSSPEGLGIPAAQVKVVLSPTSPSPILVTDRDGAFEVRVPAGVTRVVFGIAAPGYSYKITSAASDTADSSRIVLDRSGGTLRLTGDLHPGSVIVKDGAFESVKYMLRAWDGSVDGEETVLRNVSPGDYAFCGGGVDVVGTLMSATTRPISHCRNGRLLPGGDLALSLPPTNKQ
jgi:hypothetical protein